VPGPARLCVAGPTPRLRLRRRPGRKPGGDAAGPRPSSLFSLGRLVGAAVAGQCHRLRDHGIAVADGTPATVWRARLGRIAPHPGRPRRPWQRSPRRGGPGAVAGESRGVADIRGAGRRGRRVAGPGLNDRCRHLVCQGEPARPAVGGGCQRGPGCRGTPGLCRRSAFASALGDLSHLDSGLGPDCCRVPGGGLAQPAVRWCADGAGLQCLGGRHRRAGAGAGTARHDGGPDWSAMAGGDCGIHGPPGGYTRGQPAGRRVGVRRRLAAPAGSILRDMA
jgi:hypothetical protein